MPNAGLQTGRGRAGSHAQVRRGGVPSTSAPSFRGSGAGNSGAVVGGMKLSSPFLRPILLSLLMAFPAPAGFRTEYFDREPPNWEGVNNRNKFFETRTVEQNFGYSAETNHAGGQKGEAGGRINPAGEPAYYGFKLPKPIDLSTPITA